VAPAGVDVRGEPLPAHSREPPVTTVVSTVPAPRAAPPPGLERLTASVLFDALPDASTRAAASGRITAVNRAWRAFALDNGGTEAATCEGVDYLGVCDRAAARGSTEAAEVARGLRAVLGGERFEIELDYACPAPAVGRWFVVRVTAVRPGPPCALVTHVNITRRKLAERDLQRQASTDPLTGLGNRVLLDERLARALTPRRGRPPVAGTGVLVIDLDGFKPVNDTLGHDAGDEVLQVVADRLRSGVRPQDTVARLGGDEFVVVAPRVSARALADLTDRVRQSLVLEHRVGGATVRVQASVGGVLAAPGEDPAEVLRRGRRGDVRRGARGLSRTARRAATAR
jgi:diguanylate cyclase (GGDEF)-like protein